MALSKNDRRKLKRAKKYDSTDALAYAYLYNR